MNPERPTVAFYTFGCRLNQAETAIIENTFAERGYEIRDYRQPADVVVINTCTVTENGDRDTRRLINRLVRLNPNTQIALIGCQAQVQKDRLLRLPNVHWVVGNARKMELATLLEDGIAKAPQVITPVIPRESFTIPGTGIDKRRTRANLKIQDGCDFFCSFCEIPYARGRARSREFPNILEEARSLVAAGHHELVLTGINIGTYRYNRYTFLDVVSELEKIANLWRIRISSIEPTTIPEEILRRMGPEGKLCRHLHIPIQSGNDEILRTMQRKYSVSEFARFVRKAESQVEGLCLGTDVIVGFPGETRSHFDDTYQLLLELPFAYFHVFSYSERQHARSVRLGAPAPRAEIEHRSKRLRELSKRKRRLYYESFLGQNVLVLFEQGNEGWWSGFTDNYIRVHVKSSFKLGNKLLPVKLEKIENEKLIGTLL